jgi:hypothetical protein
MRTNRPQPQKTVDTNGLPLFLLTSLWDNDTTDKNESTKDGDSTNDKVGKQDEVTINVDTGSEEVSGPVPTPDTEKRNNKVSFLDIAGNKARKVSYVDNHSW